MILRILLFPVVLLLVLYFAIAQVVPTYQAIKAEQSNKEQKQKTLAAAEKKLAQVNQFVSDVESHSEEKDFTLTYLPNDQREEALINDIWQIAELSGETFNLFSIGFSDGGGTGQVSGHTARLIEGRLIVSGTYEEFQRFFDQMFRLDRLYTFKTIDLTKPERKEQEEQEGPQILSGTVAFAYGYVPGEVAIDPTVFEQNIDYELISTIKDAVAPTEPLVTHPEQRNNPFLP
jgi:Tfp pilus assembly protein PilO